MVKASPVRAEYAAIWSIPETATSGQSDRGGQASSRLTATNAKRQEVAIT